MRKSKMLLVIFSLLILSSFVAAGGTGFANLSAALSSLCAGIRSIIPIIAFLMIVAAGAIYAAGQLLGAETRARASVWATAMLVGAVIGLLIVVVTPGILGAMYSPAVSC